MAGGFQLAQWLRPQALSESSQVMHFRTADRWLLPDLPAPEDQLRFQMATSAVWPHPSLHAGAIGQLPIQFTPAVGEYAEWFGTGYDLPRMQEPLKCLTWRPDAMWYVCYRGPQQSYFDDLGCVPMRFNRFGMRDSLERQLTKPTGTQRVLCLGDSLTLAWGVREEQSWPRLLEQELASHRPSPPGAPIEVVNAGGTATSYLDEYALALEHRHGRFQPDLVLVTLCLNDLLVTNGRLGHLRPDALPLAEMPPEDRRWWMEYATLAEAHRRLSGAAVLDLDPARDWVQELLDLPDAHLYYRGKGETRAMYWPGGMPQRSLLAMRDWCGNHGARFAVVVWPLLQGLGSSRSYPFAKMHARLADFCQREGLPLLDLLPTFALQEQESLWVSPADMHPNERAQQLAAPVIAAFCSEQLAQ